jgi:RNA polymerase primary sigma factor
VGTLHKIGKISSSLQQEYGREPSAKEIAKELSLTEGEVSDTLKISNSHLSLDAPFSVSEDNSLIDILEDEMQPSPDESLLDDSLRVEIEKALDTLTPREAEVINLYFGLSHEKPLTLEEIGARFSLTRERVRQIKEKAIRRLRHASRSKALRAYLN